MQALEKQKLLEWAEKDRERMKQEFEAKLELNLQLVEEKKCNEQLQAELLSAKLTHTSNTLLNADLDELPSSLTVDVGDIPVNVANADTIITPHALSRVESRTEHCQSITASYATPLVEIGPFLSSTGGPPR